MILSPGGLGSGPFILATSRKKKKEGRKEKRLTLLKYVREVSYYTKQTNNVPQSRESQVTRAKAPLAASIYPPITQAVTVSSWRLSTEYRTSVM